MGITLDTGALIAYERRGFRIRTALHLAMRKGLRITIPTVVLAEWYRGKNQNFRDLLDASEFAELSGSEAYKAGLALAEVSAGPSVVDACVMAIASTRGDVVYTSDYEDLRALGASFPGVKVLQV